MYRELLCLLLVLGNMPILSAQETYRIISYNVENLFDTKNDDFIDDDNFTPEGNYHWTKARYTDKLLKISRAIRLAGGEKFAILVGLCEIENRKVLDDLVNKTMLGEAGYEIIHRDSPDPRGIDVALLYRPDIFVPINVQYISPETIEFQTREVLYVRGTIGIDTMHIFMCHFPSMSGGEKQSEWKRHIVAREIRENIDSIYKKSPKANIIIMGDLNGQQGTPAQKKTLRIQSFFEGEHVDSLLYYTTARNSSLGTYRFRGGWQIIDHIIASGSLLNISNNLHIDGEMRIMYQSSLVEEDLNYYGFKPFRTYVGMRYNGGTSDHLPIYIDINVSF